MGKNKHKNKAKRYQNGGRRRDPQPVVVVDESKVAQECLEAHLYLSQLTTRMGKLQGNCMIITKRWLEVWKHYVAYDYLTGRTSEEPKYNKKHGRKVPPALNQDIVRKDHSLIQIPQELPEYTYLNTIVSLGDNEEVIGIIPQLWQVFSKNYPGTPIERPTRRLKSGKVIVDSELLRCEILFVGRGLIEQRINEGYKNSPSELIPMQKIQMSTLWELPELLTFVGTYCSFKFGTSEITLWKGLGYVSTTELQEELFNCFRKDGGQLHAYQLSQENFKGLDVDDFIKTTHTLIVMLDQKINCYPYSPQGNISGYCENCAKKKPLIFYCGCEKMYYCSNECLVQDLSFHSGFCKQAFDSDDDADYESLTVQKVPLNGLVNLGNTCYMNSAIQALLSVTPLRLFFSREDLNRNIDPKELESNNGVFVKKWSKFCKIVALEKGPVTPWSLKVVVDHFIKPFKGFKQHDSNDFLLAFLNTLNECLARPGNEAYHQFLSSCLMGKYLSLLSCPECNDQISNVEQFMQLSLPIKSASKVQTCTYALVSSPYSVQRGKIQVPDSWKALRKFFNTSPKCLVSLGSEAEMLDAVDENEMPAAAFRKAKREIVIFQNIFEADQGEMTFFVQSTIMKKIAGMELPSRIGYNHPVNADLETSLVRFWCRVMEQFKASSIELVALVDAYDNQDQEDQEREALLLKFLAEARRIIGNHNFSLRVIDRRRVGKKQTCRFCKRHCTGCELELSPTITLSDYFGEYVGEVSFEAFMPERGEQVIVEQNLATSGDASLSDCLTLFSVPEKLDQENAWYCGKCDKMQLANKQMLVNVFPPILIIQLNRFKTVNDRKVKNNDPVTYQQEQTFGDRKYYLLAVIVHEGSIEGGHYWAICWRETGYHIFNDSQVVPTNTFLNKNAYVLIYELVK